MDEWWKLGTINPQRLSQDVHRNIIAKRYLLQLFISSVFKIVNKFKIHFHPVKLFSIRSFVLVPKVRVAVKHEFIFSCSSSDGNKNSRLAFINTPWAKNCFAFLTSQRRVVPNCSFQTNERLSSYKSGQNTAAKTISAWLLKSFPAAAQQQTAAVFRWYSSVSGGGYGTDVFQFLPLSLIGNKEINQDGSAPLESCHHSSASLEPYHKNMAVQCDGNMAVATPLVSAVRDTRCYDIRASGGRR